MMEEREIIEAEEIVGTYLFIHPESLHIPYSLKSLNYRARSPYFAELLQVACTGLSGGKVNFRAHLSPETYRFWHEKSMIKSLAPSHYEQVADALALLCDTAKCDALQKTLKEIEQKLSPHNISVVMHELLERTAVALYAGSWQIQAGSTLRDQYIERLKSIHETKNFPLYTHLPMLDEMDIFLPRREYTLISGRTGVGKTSLACILTYNLLFSHERNDEKAATRPLNILYISLEVPSEAIFAKIVNTFVHSYILPKEKLNIFPQFSEEDYQQMKKLTWNNFYAQISEDKFELIQKIVDTFMSTIGDRLAIYHSPVLSGDDIVLLVTSRALELLAQGKYLDVVVIDFIQNLRTRSEARGQHREGISLTREIGHTIQELQQVFSKFEICGIVLSQVNDVGEVRDSRVLEHLAATHIRIGAFAKDFTPLFMSHFSQQENVYLKGKPVTREVAKQEAQRLNSIAQNLPQTKLLDIAVTKNRYGREFRVPRLIAWKPAIPKIVNSYNLADAISFLEKCEDAVRDKMKNYVNVTPLDDFPF